MKWKKELYTHVKSFNQQTGSDKYHTTGHLTNI